VCLMQLLCTGRSKKGQPGTLDDWLGSGQGGAASSPRDMPPLLLPRVPLPPLMLPSGDAGAVRPAKKRKGLTAADRDVEAVMLRMLKQVWVAPVRFEGLVWWTDCPQHEAQILTTTRWHTSAH
jgi:hypothetical protein